MDEISSLLAMASISILGTISPGPDFCIVLKNSLSYSRKAGLFTALGISLALVIHLSYSLLGIGLFIAENPFFYALVKYTGVVYLFYIGLSNLVLSFRKVAELDLNQARSPQQISLTKALLQGFLTNLLNVGTVLFFISLFSQFIEPTTSTALMIGYGLINWATALSWNLFLAYLVTCERLIKKIQHFKVHIDRALGSALLLLGVKLLLVA